MSREPWSRNWDRMSFEEQREYRDRKLAYFVRTQLYPYSQFYRKLFDENGIDPNRIRGVDDLGKLPFTSKVDIAPDADDPEKFRTLVLQPDEELFDKYASGTQRARRSMNRLFRGDEFVRKQIWRQFSPVHVQFTTGHTRRPTPIMYSAEDVERMAEAGRRILELAGFGTRIDCAGASVINLMPFAPHLAFWMSSKALDKAGILALNSGGGRVLGTQRIINAVEDIWATGLTGMPSYVYHILRAAAEQGCDFSSVKVLVISGERISKGMKKKISELLEDLGAKDAVVIGAYGFTEGRKSYSECSPDPTTGYHLYPDMDYIELIDPKTGEPVPEGEDGELVYTCLGGQGTCVMRFRTGDMVRGGLVYEPCPSCGRIVPRIGSDITRGAEVKGFYLTKLKGTLVDQGAFFSALANNPGVADWQVEINKAEGDPYEVDLLNVYVAAEPGTTEDDLRTQIENELELLTEVKPNRIEFLQLDQLVERLCADGGIKELRFVDRRPQE